MRTEVNDIYTPYVQINIKRISYGRLKDER